jgi:hypothetical protein
MCVPKVSHKIDNFCVFYKKDKYIFRLSQNMSVFVETTLRACNMLRYTKYIIYIF